MNKLIILCLGFMVMSTTCKKKEPKDYLPGNWGVFAYKEDGADKTNEFLLKYQAYQLTFDSKGNYTEFYRLAGVEKTIEGTWDLENNNLQLRLVDNDPNSIKKIRILNVVNTITESALNLGEDNKEYDLQKM